MNNVRKTLEFLSENSQFDAKVKCLDCKWKGKYGDLHTDRGGHNFLCPKCKSQNLKDV